MEAPTPYIIHEKFSPATDEPLMPESDLFEMTNVSEADLWDAINDWLENFQPAEFRGLIDAEIE